MDSREASTNLGWAIVGLTLANIAVNYVGVLITVVRTVFLLIRKLYYKWKLKRLQKAKKDALESKTLESTHMP